MGHKAAILIGSAGSGKTTELLRVLETAKDRLGGDPFAVGFASMTRAARLEALERASAAWGVSEKVLGDMGWFKTVHAICKKQLGVGKELISNDKESQEWVAEAVGAELHTFLDYGEDCGFRYEGDMAAAKAMQVWSYVRAAMVPLRKAVERWLRSGDIDPPSMASCLQYIRRYENAKRKEGRVDFMDLLARFAGIHFDPIEGPQPIDPEGEPPKGVKAWIFDEAQDASALLDTVCRRLASSEEVVWVWLAGDPFQSCLSFTGSSADHFLSWPCDKKKIMPKSYRCPAPILKAGEWSLRQMRKGYFDRGVSPADHEGIAVRVNSMEQAARKIDPSESTLVLFRANYLAEQWAKKMTEKGIPCRELKRHDNTHLSRAHKALWDLEHGIGVSAEDFALAIDELPQRTASGPTSDRGTKKQWKDPSRWGLWECVTPADLPKTGLTELGIAKIKSGEWGSLVEKGESFRASAKKHGGELAAHPKVLVGTVHGSKGMEADTVVLSTTLTRRIAEAKRSDYDAYDEERRIEYIGITRARRRLIVSDDFSDMERMNINL